MDGYARVSVNPEKEEKSWKDFCSNGIALETMRMSIINQIDAFTQDTKITLSSHRLLSGSPRLNTFKASALTIFLFRDTWNNFNELPLDTHNSSPGEGSEPSIVITAHGEEGKSKKLWWGPVEVDYGAHNFHSRKDTREAIINRCFGLLLSTIKFA